MLGYIYLKYCSCNGTLEPHPYDRNTYTAVALYDTVLHQIFQCRCKPDVRIYLDA